MDKPKSRWVAIHSTILIGVFLALITIGSFIAGIIFAITYGQHLAPKVLVVPQNAPFQIPDESREETEEDKAFHQTPLPELLPGPRRLDDEA